MNLDGFSLSPLVFELNDRLAGGRISKIFQLDKHTLIIWVRQSGEDIRLVISANPERPRIHIATSVPENPAAPPAFCMLLRKHLADGRIARISQHNLDRVVALAVDVRDEHGMITTSYLIAELMGKHSNIIFTHNHVIIDAIKRVSVNMSRYRQVLPGKEYIFPPGQSQCNIITEPIAKFLHSVTQITGKLSKSIVAAGIGIGPVTAREIIWRAGLPCDIDVKSLDQADYDSLADAIQSLIQPLQNNENSPTVVADYNNRCIAITAFQPGHLQVEYASGFTSYSSMSNAVEFAAGLSGNHISPEQVLLVKIISTELNRLERKRTILHQELAEAEDADTFRQYGDLLMANLYNIPHGKEQVMVTNLFSDNPDEQLITIPIESRLTPLENARTYYTKYNKLKRAKESLAVQLRHCQQEFDYLETIEVALTTTLASAELSDIREELSAAGYIKLAGKKRRASPVPVSPTEANAQDGSIIIIGKNNRQNDFVTFKLARPNDLWFHTKDIPGSHVILRCDSAAPTESGMKAASQLAAYFSKARESANVPVDYTRRKHVKKPSGAKPGFVIYERQNTIYVTPKADYVAKLLNR
ncbi:MAG: NFACT family protein [Veillonellales bacterium]